MESKKSKKKKKFNKKDKKKDKNIIVTRFISHIWFFLINSGSFPKFQGPRTFFFL